MTVVRAALVLLLAAGCAGGGGGAPPAAAPPPTEARPVPLPEREPSLAAPDPRPAWLGQRVLPRRPDGYGAVLPTPEELRDRRLPPPADDLPELPGDGYAVRIGEVPDDVLARSTWQPGCPVGPADLRYVLLRFRGFDDRPHTGELLVHREVAEDVAAVFGRLYELRFPIEEMRVVAAPELEAPPTGDGNNTTAFVCRPARGSSRWSQHAQGLAVDINPFHNPYERVDLVLPELASAYTDRTWVRPGMILADGPVVAAFRGIGWGWGGDWDSPVDPMHFSRDGT